MDMLIQFLSGYIPHMIMSLSVFIIVLIVTQITKKFKLPKQNSKQYIQVLFKEGNMPYHLGERLGVVRPAALLRIFVYVLICILTILMYFVWTSEHPEIVELRKVISILAVMLALAYFGAFSISRRCLSIYTDGVQYCNGLTRRKVYFSEIKSMSPILLTEQRSYQSVHLATHQIVEAYHLELRNGKTMKMKVGRTSNIDQLSVYLDVEKNPYVEAYRYLDFQSNKK